MAPVLIFLRTFKLSLKTNSLYFQILALSLRNKIVNNDLIRFSEDIVNYYILKKYRVSD